ncbi:MAG: hypothetical protein LBJ10_10320, partial [Clostridiales bacterium]|nr:hypothetical protein [Clostridiales bacterium]
TPAPTPPEGSAQTGAQPAPAPTEEPAQTDAAQGDTRENAAQPAPAPTPPEGPAQTGAQPATFAPAQPAPAPAPMPAESPEISEMFGAQGGYLSNEQRQQRLLELEAQGGYLSNEWWLLLLELEAQGGDLSNEQRELLLELEAQGGLRSPEQQQRLLELEAQGGDLSPEQRELLLELEAQDGYISPEQRQQLHELGQKEASELQQRLLEQEEARERQQRLKQAEADRLARADALRGAARELSAFERTDGLGFYISDGVTTIGDESIMDAAIGDAATGGPPMIAGAFKSRAAWLAYEHSALGKSPKTPRRYAGMERSLSMLISHQDYPHISNHYDSDYPNHQYDSSFGSIGNFEMGNYLAPSKTSALGNYPAGDLALYLSFDESFIAERASMLRDVREMALPWLMLMLAGAALSLALLIFLIAATGRRDECGNVALCKADRVFTELQLALLIAAAWIALAALILPAESGSYWMGYSIGSDSLADTALVSAASLAMCAAGLWFLLSLIRNIKARRFFRNSLIWGLCALMRRGARAVFGGARALFGGGAPKRKMVLLALAVCALSATVVLAPAVFALILVLGPKWLRRFADIKRGVDEVKSGNLSWKIPVADGARGELDELARGINEISGASKAAIQNELKAQRLKTDLISNVSHDLKTPLTSIITYVDLMKREGPAGPSAEEYLGVIDNKSQRLKKLADDLFEAAKASSGAMPVRPEKVDLLSLVRQGLGEMHEGIAARRLEARLSFESEKHYVRADGQLLWRIVENMLGNVQKYALEGSRVYIVLSEKAAGAGMALLEIKNISEAPLNISADELTERFTRGDESRAEDGSGLGLAIAKDLARLQNGRLEIKIDGDLFKCALTLERWEDGAGGSSPADAAQ